MTNMTGKPELLKKMNIKLLYEALISLQTATRAELAQKTQISPTTIRSLLSELTQSGDIIELTLDESSGGRRAQRYSLNPDRNNLLSLYFEGNSIHYQVNQLTGVTIETGHAPLDTKDSNHCILAYLKKWLQKWNICAVGLGVPGIVENERYYVSSGQNQWVIHTIGEQIRNTYALPVILENDLNAIAYGFMMEYVKNHSNLSMKDMTLTYIHFNEGCTGAGIIAHGEIIHGAKQFAGELGFLPIFADETLDTAMAATSTAEETADIISRIIAIVNCVTNPFLIAIGGSRVGAFPDMQRLVRQKMQSYIADIVQPEIIVSQNNVQDYLSGLSYLTLQKLIPLLPLK